VSFDASLNNAADTFSATHLLGPCHGKLADDHFSVKTHDVRATAMLWDSVVGSIKHSSINHIAKLSQCLFNHANGVAIIVGLEAFDVLQEKGLRLLFSKDSDDVMKQGALCWVIETLSTAYRAERLARKSSQQNVEVGDDFCFNLRDVTVRCLAEVPFIGALGIFVPLRAKDAIPTCALERNAHASDAREEVDKSKTPLGLPQTGSIGHSSIVGAGCTDEQRLFSELTKMPVPVVHSEYVIAECNEFGILCTIPAGLLSSFSHLFEIHPPCQNCILSLL